eukprot:s239_g6.t1
MGIALKPHHIHPDALSEDDLQAPVCLLQHGVGQGGHHTFDDLPLRKELLAAQKAQQELAAAQKAQQDLLKKKRLQEMNDMASVHFDFDNLPVRKELLAAQHAQQVPMKVPAKAPSTNPAKPAKVQTATVPAPTAKVLKAVQAMPRWPTSLEDLLGHRIPLRSQPAGLTQESQEEELQMEDQRLREEDSRLRQENERLQHALLELSSATNRSGTMAEDMATVLTSLLEEPTKAPKHAKLPHAGNKTYMGTGSHEMDPKKRVMTVSLIICGVICFIVYVAYHAYVYFRRVLTDPRGDHQVDYEDVREFFAELICCGLSYSSAVNMSFVFVIAGAGFGFLWWQGIIQPFLKELACYVYLGLIVSLLVGVIFAELWSKFFDVFSQQMQAMEKIMGFLRIDKAQDFARDLFHEAEDGARRIVQ